MNSFPIRGLDVHLILRKEGPIKALFIGFQRYISFLLSAEACFNLLLLFFYYLLTQFKGTVGYI